MSNIKAVLRYPGSKWNMAQWIISHFPPFDSYVEPYFGSGSVFLSLASMPRHAVLNDKSKSIVNLFEVMRTRSHELCTMVELTPWSRDEYEASYEQTGDELEDARRFLVRCWMAHGTRLNQRTGWRHNGSKEGKWKQEYQIWNQLPSRIAAVAQRLKYAEIENRDALEIIERFAANTRCLLYVDPPYVLSTRNGAMYEHELSDTDHLQLLEALKRHTGPVSLSGYDHPIYKEMLQGWQKVTIDTLIEKGHIKTESLWLNEKASQSRQLHLFGEESGVVA